jgi:hypothetical protein
VSGHGIALRTPWYVGLRDPDETKHFDRFDDRAKAPAIQMYDRTDFVDVLLADPRASLAFGPADRWSFAMPRPAGTGGTLRERLSSHQLVRTPMRKLFQPSHQRFYTVTIELFCDAAGLPRAASGDAPTVAFVVRRLRPTFRTADEATLKEFTRLAVKEFLDRDAVTDQDVGDDVTAAFRLALDDDDEPRRMAFERKNADLLGEVGLSHEVQAWYVGCDGRGQWKAVGDVDPDLEEKELELPMWRIPPDPRACERARTRSLWFGVVPTFSADLDRTGEPRFDDRATYVLQCVARRNRPAPHAHCPPEVGWSGQSRPYRVAPFFDPAGSAQRPVRVKLPDFRALAAHVGEPRPVDSAGRVLGAGGVQFERPPGSQLAPVGLGEIPTGGKPKPGGGAAEICSFSIELITIVATFVLSLFLPIVVFAFQLWWLLMLKFCWPRPADVGDLLTALESTPITSLPPGGPAAQVLTQMLGVERTAAAAVIPKLGELSAAVGTGKDAAAGFVGELAIDNAPTPALSTPEPLPEDPLC